MTTHASNGAFQKEELNGEIKSGVAGDFVNTQSWHIFSHSISVKTGLPDRELWSQEDGHHTEGEISCDTLELEKATLPQHNGHQIEVKSDILELEKATLPQEDHHPLEFEEAIEPRQNGHHVEASWDTLELKEKTATLPVEEGPALAQPAAHDLTVVIPTRNEQDNIVPLLHELQAALDGMRVEIIFVDDSDDDTPRIIKDALVAMATSRFHIHVEHRQPGAAREGGLATAVVHGMHRAQAEYVAIIDADLQHPPEQLRVFYEQAVAQHADLVIASRYIRGGSYQGLAGVGRRCISVGLKWTAKQLFPGQLRRISDPLGGFFLLRRCLLDNVTLRPIGYKILLELLIRCQWQQVLEVPYHFQARAAGQSKATIQQGILALRHMLRLWREVPAAGRVWKISMLLPLNALMTLAWFIVNKSFPWVWAKLNIFIIGVIACMDFVLFKRFIFPLKAPLQRITIPTAPIDEISTDVQFEVMRYAEWLNAEAKRNNTGSRQEESNKYAEVALRTVTINGQEFRPFAPFRLARSARKTLTSSQAFILGTLGLIWSVGLILLGMKVVIITFVMIIVLYLSALLVNFWLSIRTLGEWPEEQIDDAIVHALADADWPRYTILCPLYRETEVVPQFVQAMQALDYPTDKLQILFLTEEDDVETRKAIAAMHLPQHFSIVTVPDGKPRTKPRACNFGLLQATGDYVVIYDAEDIPNPLQLKKAILTFTNHDCDLACVQAKLNYYNTQQNLLTRLFTVEYSLWFDLILPGMQESRLPLPLGGTSNHFRAGMLRSLGGWDAFNVTEDCDLGLRMAYHDFKTVMLDSTTYEEATSRVKNWLLQRSRWVKGYMQTYLVHMRIPLYYLRIGRLREFFSLQLVIGGKTAVLFVNPLMWLMLLIYILFRPLVSDVYHMLFPTPILYMGVLCLIFGNFFYVYSNLIGCLKRGQYGLIRWALFTPFYWMIISMAACIALVQLIIKPHYWAKTQHGFHLYRSGSSAASTTVEEKPKPVDPMQLAASTSTKLVSTPLPASRSSSASTPTTKDIESKVTVPLAAFRSAGHLSERHPKHPARQSWLKDPWLLAAFIVAGVASSAACWYFFQHHQLLLYEDAISHLRIARRVFDNTPPGLTQLGGVWLPLPQFLMLPFIWNDYLWRTGLAGSFPAMLCYLVAVVYLFLSARRLTHDSRASFVGTLLFILNPNILYLQTTALSEIVCIATSVMACYYFLAWTQDDNPKYLVGVAAGTFLATMSRFDGWGLLLVLLVLIVAVMLIKRLHRVQIEGTLLIFGSLGTLGIVLWILWDAVIFGDPLYWHHYLYGNDLATQYYTYHELWQSISVYMLLSLETVGPILFVLAAIAIVVFVFRRRLAPDMFGAMTFLTPFVFYILVLYSGQDTIFLPGVGPANTSHYLWNVRFGAEIVAPAALFLAILAEGWSISIPARIRPLIGQIVIVIAIVIQTILTASGGIISLQDGQYGESCTPVEPITVYLAQHYNGGRILEAEDAFRIDESEAGIDLKNTIYEGSTELWQKALNDPASMVEWIIVPSAVPNDRIAKRIDLASPAFLSKFTLVVEQPDQFRLRLYHRNGHAPLPTQPIPSSLLSDHRLCSASGF
jgi:cellulose synthase/poly-beta-1,6-N-acetylglucosamine synthase-like glycosyltransferase